MHPKLLKEQEVSRKGVMKLIITNCYRGLCPLKCSFLVVKAALIPVLQLVLVLLMILLNCVIVLVTLLVLSLIMASNYFARKNAANPFLFYWTISSITYIAVIVEGYVVPFLSITMSEHNALLLLTLTAIYFFYLTKSIGASADVAEYQNGELSRSGVHCSNICPICRLEQHERSYHCHICQTCIPKYNYHCFWLDCCIGECNVHTYFVGLFFSFLALLYTSHLILTTICRPDFEFGILVPKDCSDVFNNTGMTISYICAVYCLELVAVLFIRFVYHFWLISKGFTAFEFRTNWRKSICTSSPYSRGCLANWGNFLQSFKMTHLFNIIPGIRNGKR